MGGEVWVESEVMWMMLVVETALETALETRRALETALLEWRREKRYV